MPYPSETTAHQEEPVPGIGEPGRRPYGVPGLLGN